MQVFLPIKVQEASDVVRIAHILDRLRLNKQLIECKTLIEGGWTRHPAYKMYMHDDTTAASLLFYAINLALTYPTIHGKIHSIDFNQYLPEEEYDFELPHWFSDEEFVSLHSAALIRKVPSRYTQFNDVLANACNVFTLQDINHLILLEKDEVLRENTNKHKFNYEHNTGGDTELYEKVQAIYKKTPNVYWSHSENKYIYYPQTY